jgi:hypothetical protein
VPSLADWVAGLGPGVAGADPALVGAGEWLEWEETMAAGGVTLQVGRGREYTEARWWET